MKGLTPILLTLLLLMPAISGCKKESALKKDFLNEEINKMNFVEETFTKDSDFNKIKKKELS